MIAKNETKNAKIEPIAPGKSIAQFVQYLDFPLWFEERFVPEFTTIFDAGGEDNRIFIAKERNDIVGCVHCHLKPNHRYNGQVIPIFGWLKGDSEGILKTLLNACKSFAKSRGHQKIRGPINQPKQLGGWGIITKGFGTRPTLNAPRDQPRLAHFFESTYGNGRGNGTNSADVTTYYNNTLDRTEPIATREKNVELVNPAPEKLFSNEELSSSLVKLIQSGFSSLLPDTSVVENQFAKYAKIYAQVQNPQDFYELAIDKDTKEVVGCLIACPNLCDLWSGGKLESCLFDSIVIAKKWRRTNLGKKLWFTVADRLRARGITDQINNYLWEENVAVLKFQEPYSVPRHEIKVYTIPA